MCVPQQPSALCVHQEVNICHMIPRSDPSKVWCVGYISNNLMLLFTPYLVSDLIGSINVQNIFISSSCMSSASLKRNKATVVVNELFLDKLITICDMIKRNELDVGNVVFDILAKTVFKFLCFILFLSMSNPS